MKARGAFAHIPQTHTIQITQDLKLLHDAILNGDAKTAKAVTYNATEIGSPTYDTGKIGDAISLDGFSQYAQAGDPSLTGPEPKSVSLWFHKLDTSSKGAFSFGAQNQAGLFEMLMYNGVVAGHFYGSDTIAGGPAYTPNQWHHTAITYDGTRVQVYYDGQPANSKALALNTSPGPLLLGTAQVQGWNAYAYFNGLIDDVGLWNRALNAGEVKAIYTAGLADQDLS